VSKQTRKDNLIRAVEGIRELLPSAVITVKTSQGMPGLEPHQYIEVDP